MGPFQAGWTATAVLENCAPMPSATAVVSGCTVVAATLQNYRLEYNTCLADLYNMYTARSKEACTP